VVINALAQELAAEKVAVAAETRPSNPDAVALLETLARSPAPGTDVLVTNAATTRSPRTCARPKPAWPPAPKPTA